MPRFATLIALALVSLASTARGQHTAPPAEAQRKVVTRIAPDYPELAHRLHIHGVVKVEAQVRANGSVKSAKVLGGNPVLVDAAVTAVEKWKFEAALNESTELVQVIFQTQ